jgi:hypothetical protein
MAKVTMQYWRKVTIGVLAAAIGVLLARQNGWSLPRWPEGETHANGRDRVEVISKPYTLDRIYLSMTGPSGNHPVDGLLPHEKSQLVWLTGLWQRPSGLGTSGKAGPLSLHLVTSPSRSGTSGDD